MSRFAERSPRTLRTRGPRALGTLRPGALDWLNFLMANVQTGFGPFIAVYLTAHSWTQTRIGLVLSIGTISGIASQVPAGALIDATRAKRFAAGLAIAAIMASALMFAVWPNPFPVLLAEILHGFASAMVVPAIAAISLTLVTRREVGGRLGRNAGWAAFGNAFAAGMMGWVGWKIGLAWVFWFAAALALPALLALAYLPPPLPPQPPSAPALEPWKTAREQWWRLFRDRRLLAIAGCAALFQLSNAAMLQLVGGELTKEAGTTAAVVIAACIVLPQLVVAVLAPWVGRAAERRGRKLILGLGFLALPVRGALFAITASPPLVVTIQILDGMAGATFGVLVPLIAADAAAEKGRFNLALGTILLSGGIGAAVSSTLAGSIADAFGERAAFIALAVAGAAAVLLVWAAMPEIRQVNPAAKVRPAAAFAAPRR